MNDNVQWTLMLKRQFPPIIQSIYGIYVSVVYDKFMAIYKDGVSFWFIDKRFFEANDNNYIERMRKRDIHKECSDTIQLYDRAYKNVIDILKEYEENKEQISKSQLLKLFYDEKFLKDLGTKSTTDLKEEITKVKTLFDNYGVIASCPRMTIASFAQDNLVSKLAYLQYGISFDELNDHEKVSLGMDLAVLNWNEKLFDAPYVKYEKDLLRIALDVKNKLALNNVIDNIIEEIRNDIINSDCFIGPGLDWLLQKRIKEVLRDNIRKDPIVIKFMENYGWIGNVWEFGGKLDENDKDRIAGRILQYVISEKLPEIYLTEMEEKKKIWMERRKKLIDELTQVGKEHGIDFKRECLPYADIFAMNQTNRFYRKCYLPMINTKIGELMEDIATKIGLDNWKDIHYLTMTEILEGLNNGLVIEQEELKKRREAFLTIFENGKDSFKMSGKDAVDSYVNQLIDEERLNRKPWPDYEVKWDKNTPLKGIALNIPEGKTIKGRVFVLHTPQDFPKIEEGDIVVAHMIEPYHTVYMMNIGGIIVEDLSTLSHAVIIAQTQNIPIIIGAKDIIYAIFRDKVQKVAMEWNGEIQKIEWGKPGWNIFV